MQLSKSAPVHLDVRSSLGVSNHRDPAPTSLPSSAQARKAEKTITEKHRPQSKLSLTPHTEPDARKSSPVAREVNTCKKRPDSKKAARSKGGGGGKKYIPWCG